jgi:succinate dehydrogenase / fumarate reductase flavoprotein subunit/fumarate reductase flavoprotein subunit
MLYRAGCQMRDMEMIQFHPTGLMIAGSVIAGALLEEGLRGAGAHLYNGEGERYMLRYAPDVAERATRDVVSRAAFTEMMAGRAAPEGGVRIDAAHLGAEFVLKNFPGMSERCAQFGYDLARGQVPITPTAHFFMGGAVIDKDCHAPMEKLFVAGEDAGGVHGANRLGGNGICESCVYGRQAGKSLARYLSKPKNRTIKESAPGMAKDMQARLVEPLARTGGRSPLEIKHDLQEVNWLKVGIVRNKTDLEAAMSECVSLRDELGKVGISGSSTYNMIYGAYLDTMNLIDTSIMAAASALQRDETRGAHTRSDFPEQRDDYGLFNIFLRRGSDGLPVLEKRDVAFTHRSLETCQQYRK